MPSGATRRGLVVLLGAGASHQCQTAYEQLPTSETMPLVTGLFNRNEDLVAPGFELIQSLAGDLRIELRAPPARPAVTVETYIRRLVDHADEPNRRAGRIIPVYLQALIWRLSNVWRQSSDNYSRLVWPVLGVLPPLLLNG